MNTHKNLQMVGIVFFLALAICGPLAQDVNATLFFDSKVILGWKSDPALRTFLSHSLPSGQTRVSVVLVFSQIPSSDELQTLVSMGNIRTFTGHVATMTLPQESLQRLATLGFIEHISIPKTMKAQLDISVPEIMADKVWSTIKDPNGNPVNGSGVIVGIIDSGIDYLHKDFLFKNGTNKILYIWDQSVEGNSPMGFGYGNECLTYDIQIGACSEVDTGTGALEKGHGTAVASVAASTGQASGKYFGVAPGASIIAVKLKAGAEDYVLDGTQYLVRKARELGRPLVIDHSLGDILGSHDGTEPLELALNDFVSDGTPIVVSSGNSRDANIHVSGKLTPEQSVTVPWSNYPGETQNYIDLWYQASSTFEISVRTPVGQIVSGPTPDYGVNTPDGIVVILADKRATGKEWWINVTSVNGKTLQTEPWSFTLTGVTVADGRWDAWTEPGNFTITSSDMVAGRYAINPNDTVDAPGTANGVVTVGAYMTRLHWQAGCSTCRTTGSWSFAAAATEGDLEYASGAGPTRDNRTKPDITAPGASIAAARASTRAPRLSDPDNYHQMWRGTSFAAAHITGVIALMLQVNRYLSPNEIKTILTETARQDNFTGQIDKQSGSPLWGWGKVNALKSAQEAPSLYSVRLEVAPIGEEYKANVSLDGKKLLTTTLNQTRVVILEFRRDGNHTIELTQVFHVGLGTRYAVSGTPWTFSSGGAKTFEYRLQYFLQVVSPYGSATGAGWYDANSTAIVTLIPSSVQGYRFTGWSGSTQNEPVLFSDSTTIQLTMNSSKEILAVWEPQPMQTSIMQPLLVVVAIVAVAIVSIAVAVRVKRRRQETNAAAHLVSHHPSGS